MFDFSNGMTRDYFPLSQSDSNQIRGGIGEDYIGDDIYTNDYSYALDPKDYSLYGDSGFMVNNDPIEIEYADNAFLSDLPAKSVWEEALEKNDYPYAVSDYNRLKPFFRKENLGEELSIQEDCDDEVTMMDGSKWQFAYKNLNATECMCHYLNYKYPELLPGWKCFIVEKNRPYHTLLGKP